MYNMSLVHLRIKPRHTCQHLHTGNHTKALNIYERIEYSEGVLLFKSVHGLCPSYISELFTFQNSNVYILRSAPNSNMCLPSPNREIFKRTFQISGVQLWNKASVTIVAGFCPEFHPPFLWRSKHQTKMTVHINNLVPSEFPNRSSRSVRSLISTLICI